MPWWDHWDDAHRVIVIHYIMHPTIASWRCNRLFCLSCNDNDTLNYSQVNKVPPINIVLVDHLEAAHCEASGENFQVSEIEQAGV